MILSWLSFCSSCSHAELALSGPMMTLPLPYLPSKPQLLLLLLSRSLHIRSAVSLRQSVLSSDACLVLSTRQLFVLLLIFLWVLFFVCL